MSTSLKILAVLLGSSIASSLLGWEPPAEVGLKDKVRMSTLIVVGRARSISVCDRKTGKLVAADPEHYTLKPNENLCVVIKVERVLYCSVARYPSDPSNFRPDTLSAVFGDFHINLDTLREKLAHESSIYYLTYDMDRMRFTDYPFFDYTNLYDPISREPEVVRLIAAFEAIK